LAKFLTWLVVAEVKLVDVGSELEVEDGEEGKGGVEENMEVV